MEQRLWYESRLVAGRRAGAAVGHEPLGRADDVQEKDEQNEVELPIVLINIQTC